MNHGDTETQRKTLNELSGKVIGLCIEIHRELGPGLLESSYEECLAFELSNAGLAVTELHPIHEAQLLTYLKLDKKPLGLLINFNVPTVKQGVKRVACGDLFRPENGGRSDMLNLMKLLCASVPLWFK